MKRSLKVRHPVLAVFDNIGNRIVTTNDGRVLEYTANRWNQYDHRTVPGEFTMYGVAETGATVTVNNGPVSRLHEMVNGSLGEMQKFWHKDVSVTNTSEAVYQPVNVVGVYNPPGTNQDVVTVSSGNVFVAEIPEGFVYDADGNLTQDGRWVYSWDGENRLIAVETATNVENLVPKMKLDFTYDYQSRRVGKVVSVCSNSAWVAVRTNLFIYDGWNLIAEIQNSRSSSVLSTNFYVWGLDLSGSLQGAGGIGGLVSAVLDGPSSNSMVFYAYDANGNVADVINGDTGAIAAHYEYSPFGETVVQAGDAQVLALNPYAFSTKYLDRETSLYYYGYRFYNVGTGRWINRDPIGERGGINLFAFVDNCPVLLIDTDGRAWFAPPGLPVITSPPVPPNPGSPFTFIVETPEQTNLIKNDPDVRDKVLKIIMGMLAARDSSCPAGVTDVITKSFPSVSIRALADNYDKQYPWELGAFFGHTSVPLRGGGCLVSDAHLNYFNINDFTWGWSGKSKTYSMGILKIMSRAYA